MAPSAQNTATRKHAPTFRISNIPLEVTKEQLKGYLAREIGARNETENKAILKVLIVSLVRNTMYDAGWSRQTATVTFDKPETTLFPQCKPGQPYMWLPEDLDTPDDDEWGVDCDFLGMTPLYSDIEPAVE